MVAGMLRDRARLTVVLTVSVLTLGLGLLFSIPAPKPNIEAEVQVEGLDRSQDTTVTVSEGRSASLEWTSPTEALIRVVAPRDAIITLSAGQGDIAFTLHELIIYTEEERLTSLGDIKLHILRGKVVSWYANLLEEGYAALYANRFVLAVLIIFSLAYIWVRSRVRYRQLAPLLIIAAFLSYQLLFFLDLTPTLYWVTPLSDPNVRTCLVAQMASSILLVASWFPLRKLVSKVRPGLLDAPDRIIDKWGLVILIAVPLLQHLIGHGLLGYNLQPTDARYTYMDWGRAMIRQGFLSFWSRGLVRGIETPLLATVWAIVYKLVPNGYVASALVPLFFFEVVIVCTFLLARGFFGPRAGFCAALFLSLSPMFSSSAYYLMNDVPSAAMTALTLCLFILALKRESVLLALVSGGSLFLTTITKLTGIYCAFLLLVIYVFEPRRSKKILLIALSFVILLPLAYVTIPLLREGFAQGSLEEVTQQLVSRAKAPMFQIRENKPADWNYRILESGGVHYYMGPSSTLFYFQYLVNAIGFPIFFWGIMILIRGVEARIEGFDDHVPFVGINRNSLLALSIWVLALLLFLSPWAMRSTRFSYIAFPACAILGGYGFALYKGEMRFNYPRHGNLLLGLSVIMLLTQGLAHYSNVILLKNADYRDPIFIEASEPYYYVHRHYGGWHVGWNGAGTDHHFTGSITTDGYFDTAEPFELENYPDILQLSETNREITFDTWSRMNEDGCDFTIEGGSVATFDLHIDGARDPERVYIYVGSIGIERTVASTVPFTLPVD